MKRKSGYRRLLEAASDLERGRSHSGDERSPLPDAAPVEPLVQMLTHADEASRSRFMKSVQRRHGNSSANNVVSRVREERDARSGKLQFDVLVPGIQRQATPAQTPAQTPTPSRYKPPPATATGRLPGATVVVDVGDTSSLVNEIARGLPGAFKGAGSQAMAQVRSVFAHDRVQENIVNMTSGSGLTTGVITGSDTTDNWQGDVTATAKASNIAFVRADEAGLGVSSASTGAGGSTGTVTTGVQGGITGEGSAGGQGAPGGKVGGGAQVSEQRSTSGTSSMGGTTTRSVTPTPGSVLFSCDFLYAVTITYKRSPRLGWTIASLGLVDLYSSIVDEDTTWGPSYVMGTGGQVRFQGADCPPE